MPSGPTTPPRSVLDALAAHHRLAAPAVEALFAACRARPGREEDVALARRALSLAGVLSLSAGVVFFVAANWDALGPFGRFALLHALLAAAAAAALWRPPPARAGRLALLAAFVLTGALLGLFGQTYQTGSDTYELFLAWAGLGLPLVLAAGWSVTWGAWTLVVNAALALLCGWLPATHVLWTVLLGAGVTAPVLFAIAVGANVLLWALFEALRETRLAAWGAPWLGRLLVAAATVFGTWGAVAEILLSRHGPRRGGGWILGGAIFAAAAAIAAWTARRRRDVFPFAALAGGAIVVGVALLIRAAGRGADASLFLFVTAWIVASSAGAGWALMQGVRRWRGEESP